MSKKKRSNIEAPKASLPKSIQPHKQKFSKLFSFMKSTWGVILIIITIVGFAASAKELFFPTKPVIILNPAPITKPPDITIEKVPNVPPKNEFALAIKVTNLNDYPISNISVVLHSIILMLEML